MKLVAVAALCDIANLNPPLNQTLSDDETVSFLGMAAVSEEGGTGQGEDRRYVDVRKGYTPFLNGDVLVAKITPCFENGKIAQASLRHRVGFGSTEFHVVRPDPDKVAPRYLLHFLRQASVRRQGERRMTGSGGQRRVPQGFLAELALPIPALPEQRHIADVLDRAEVLRAKRGAAIATLDQLAQALFIEQFGDPVENQKGLPLRTLLELVDEDRPITYGILMPGPDQAVGVKYVRVVDMKNGGIDSSSVRRTTREVSDMYRRSLLKAGDLLLSIRGHVGRVALVPKDLEGANITQDTARLAVSAAAPMFIRECLRTPGVQGWMARHTKGVAVRGLNLGDLKRLTMPAPPRPQQESFARRVAAIEKLKSLHRASLAKLDELFASLQHRAFRGEL